MLEWAKMQIPGTEYLAETALVTATTMGTCCWSFALSSNLSSSTPSSNNLKTTWMHPWSKHWHLTDYVLMHKHDLKDVIHTKMMPNAECHNDHHLMCCKLRLNFKPKLRKGCTPKKKFNLNKLQSAEMKADFQVGLQSKFKNSDCPEDTSPQILWDQLKSAILQTSDKVLWFTTKKNQEIQELLAKKRSSYQTQLGLPSCPVRSAAFRLICSILQCKLR